ncbi:MAG TPA: glycerophosphodiester phosphodiesterase [Vicinamibacteria bacterium]|jgi:glycerophosphoryl diester phosphodiesterase
MRRFFLWFATAAVAAVAVTYLTLLLLARPVREHAFFSTATPLVVAHRGGSGLWPENTLLAFREAATLGVDVLEMDVHSTKDDVLVVLHDDTVDRTTNGKGSIRDLTLAAVQALDAGYQWTADDGASHPHRDKGVRVSTLEEVFRALPGQRVNIEIKQFDPPITDLLCRTIREHGMENRVLVASFDPPTMADFRNKCPEVATSATASEIRWFLRMHTIFLGDLYRGSAEAFEVPPQLRDFVVVTPEFVEQSHDHNIRVLVWTVNGKDEMTRLLDLGVDGILTDYPDRLISVLRQLGRSER